MVMNRVCFSSFARLLVSLGLVLGCAWGAENKKVLEKSDSAPKPPPSTFESFEQPEALASWHVLQGGAITQSQAQAKDGDSAAQWTFTAGSRLQITPCTAFANLEQPRLGRLKVWIYNPHPVTDVLTVRIGEGAELAAGEARYVFTFGLDFRGWRTLWINRLDQFAVNRSYRGTARPDTLEILPPASVTEGTLWFDNFEADQDPVFPITTDRQMPFVNQGEASREYRIAQIKPQPAAPAAVSPRQKSDLDLIARRVDDYFFPTGIDYAHLDASDPLRIRYESLLKAVKPAVERYDRLGIRRDAQGRLRGPGLYASGDWKKPKFTDFEKTWIGLVADWKLNQRVETRDKALEFLAFCNDQGYADGSAAGYVGIEHIRMNGWAIAAYLLRHELAANGRLSDEIATMKWKTLFGLVYAYDPYDLSYAYETDYIRGTMLFQLCAILMMPDSPEKVRDLQAFSRFFARVVEPKSGLRGGVKPDSTIFHHNNTYMGAYGLEALNIFSQIAFALAGTEFACSADTMAVIKRALLTYRNSANTSSLHLGLYGRMPEIKDPLLGLIGPFAAFGLAGDRELAAAFADLWDPTDPRVQATFTQATNSITYVTTLGQMVQLKAAAAKFRPTGKPHPPTPPQGCWVYPYGSYAVHRRHDWMVTCRGLSQQALNYEYGIDGYDQNSWGRYVNFGTTLVYGPGGNLGSGIDTARGWDWSRWPGSTVIRQSLDELKHANHHFYGDQPFVGGVTSGGQNGVFAMVLHDTAGDPSFWARKSWFFFGDAVICLGSDITNADANHPTETVLFQSTCGGQADLPYFFNGPKPIRAATDAQAITAAQSVWLIDPYGTGYVVPDARGLHLLRGEQESVTHLGAPSRGFVTTAWLDHGPAPRAAGYHYVIVPGAKPTELAQRAATPDYAVLRQDSQAHIVRWTRGGSLGYALFAKDVDLTVGVVARVSAPVLIYETQRAPGQVQLSVADPDLRMGRNPTYASRAITPAEIVPSAPAPVQVTVHGAWTLTEPVPPGVRLVEQPAGAAVTVFEFVAVDGKTCTVTLGAMR